MSGLHVVMGAMGSLGSAIVERLVSDGNRVRAVVRDVQAAREELPSDAQFYQADASIAEHARTACEGAEVVYLCANVRYSKWLADMPGIVENVLAGAREAHARLVFPGNVYGYGPFQQTPAKENHPLAATSRKGQLRNALEATMWEAHRSGTVPVVIPRFPDFFGPAVTNPLMGPMFEAALKGKTAAWPAGLDVPHDLVYIDDAAEACVLLGKTESAYGQVWHVPGAGPVTGRQFLDMVFKAAGTKPKMRTISRTLFRLIGPFIPDAGEMVELLYEFEQPLLLDGSKFAGAFPSFRYLPHEEAVPRTVEWFRQRV